MHSKHTQNASDEYNYGFISTFISISSTLVTNDNKQKVNCG